MECRGVLRNATLSGLIEGATTAEEQTGPTDGVITLAAGHQTYRITNPNARNGVCVEPARREDTRTSASSQCMPKYT